MANEDHEGRRPRLPTTLARGQAAVMDRLPRAGEGRGFPTTVPLHLLPGAQFPCASGWNTAAASSILLHNLQKEAQQTSRPHLATYLPTAAAAPATAQMKRRNDHKFALKLSQWLH